MARHGSHTQSWPAGSRPRPLGEVKIIIHKMVVTVVLVIKMVVIMVTLGENINNMSGNLIPNFLQLQPE